MNRAVMNKSERLNIFEQRSEAAFKNPFIKQCAQFQLCIVKYREGAAKEKFDAQYLKAAQEHLKNAFAIAVGQVRDHNSEHFKLWLRNERWSVGSVQVLISLFNTLPGCNEGATMESFLGELQVLVSEFDGSMEDKGDGKSDAGDRAFATLFNEMRHAGDVYTRLVARHATTQGVSYDMRASQLRKEDILFMTGLVAKVRSFVEKLNNAECPPNELIRYSKGANGDVLCALVTTILERNRPIVDCERKTEWEAELQNFATAWKEKYKDKLGLCSVSAQSMGRLIQDSIDKYILYENCSDIERLLVQVSESISDIAKTAMRKLSEVHNKAVSWEFLRAGLMTVFWPILAPVYLIVDAYKGNNTENSWFHAMNKDIESKFHEAPVAMFFVTVGILSSVVFAGLATAVSMGTLPAATAAALVAIHTSIAVTGLITVGGAALIGAHVYKEDCKRAIEDAEREETKRLEYDRAKLEEDLENARQKAKEQSEKLRKAAEEQDRKAREEADRKGEEARAELEFQEERRRTEEAARAEFMRRRKQRDSGSNISSLPEFPLASRATGTDPASSPTGFPLSPPPPGASTSAEKLVELTELSGASTSENSTAEQPGAQASSANAAEAPDFANMSLADMEKMKQEVMNSLTPEQAKKVSEDLETFRAALERKLAENRSHMSRLESKAEEYVSAIRDFELSR